MKSITRALAGGVAAAAMAASTVTPAFAREGHGGGIGAGEIIAGAVVLGGIAAVASAASHNDRDYGYGRAGYDGWRGDNRENGWGRDNGWNRGGGWGRDNPRQAIERCVRTAENAASRNSYGRADVTDVRDVRETRYGYEVRGRIAVNAMGRGWRNGDNRYGRGWGGDYRGWNDNLRGYDSGSFSCKVERGRVVDLDFSGIRGL